METATNPVHLYFDMPGFLYSNEKTLLCSGFLNDGFAFKTVSLYAQGQLIGTSKALPHYTAKNNGQTAANGFLIAGQLLNIKAYTAINFSLIFSGVAKTVEYKIGCAVVRLDKSLIQKKTDNPNTVLVCMPVFNPSMHLFKQQLNSILQQSYIEKQGNSIEIIIQDDASEPEIFEAVHHYVSDIPNVYLFRNENNLGFYNNIELMLHKVGYSFKYIAFSDQDDIWDRYKIEKQIETLERTKADLVYSDLKIVDNTLKMIQATFWVNRSNHLKNYHALCVNNVATGCTMLFKYKLLQHILPFPQKAGKVYHDHWVCAFTQNTRLHKVVYIDEPLVQYIQHSSNVTGFRGFIRLPVKERILSLLSLIIISLKICLKKDICDLNDFIVQNQKVYCTNLQRLKLFYLKLGYVELNKFNTKGTDVKLLFQLLFLSFKTIFQKIYLNRFEVALYTSIVVMFALKVRYFFKRDNG